MSSFQKKKKDKTLKSKRNRSEETKISSESDLDVGWDYQAGIKKHVMMS